MTETCDTPILDSSVHSNEISLGDHLESPSQNIGESSEQHIVSGDHPENSEIPASEEALHDSASATDVDSSNVEAVTNFDAEEDEDDTTEDVNVIIKPSSKGGIYKTGATYQARSTVHSSQHPKASRQGVELDDPGDIHGVPTLEFNLSTLGEEDKPWKRPGADITDYFNYGFTEETWIQYCEKQKVLRQEYANATLKPVLASGGTGMLQRLRGGISNAPRSYDSYKQANINVINLSNNTVNSRGLLNQKTPSDTAAALLNGVTGNTAGILGGFTQPPPGYPPVSAQTDGSAAFNAAAPNFSAAQLLAGPNAAGAPGMFPNLSIPPPLFNALSNWPGVPGLLPGDALIDPTTGQISAMFERTTRSPESMYSNDDRSSRRKSRHHRDGGDDDNYLDRESYRSRRRSRSDSRDRYHSRHHKHRDSGGRSERDYERRPVRRSHRSRDRFSRDERFDDDTAEPETYPAPTSAIVYSRNDRTSRDRSRDDPGRSSGHRSYKRERDRSSRSSRPSRHRSRSRSARRREGQSPSGGGSNTDEQSSRKSNTDPLLAAAAAAANIALALGEGGSGKHEDS